jgi:two-component system CheB/CheR fusion protein
MRDLAILEANPAYLNATMTELSTIRHRDIFDVFPDNPSAKEADGEQNLGASLRFVRESGRSQVMARQRYDIRRPDGISRSGTGIP